jgi:phosphoribosyl-ATP pyrophosphohydrolase
MYQQSSVLYQLMTTIKDRKMNPSPKSYTNSFMAGGVERIGQKIVEEATEVLGAARSSSHDERHGNLVHESADLIYHLFVMLSYCDVDLDDGLDDGLKELTQRSGTSGFTEKATRGENSKT